MTEPLAAAEFAEDTEDAVIVDMPAAHEHTEACGCDAATKCNVPESCKEREVVPEVEEEDEDAASTTEGPDVAADDDENNMEIELTYRAPVYGFRKEGALFGFTKVGGSDPIVMRLVHEHAVGLPVCSTVYDMVDTLRTWFTAADFFTTHDFEHNFGLIRNFYAAYFDKPKAPPEEPDRDEFDLEDDYQEALKNLKEEYQREFDTCAHIQTALGIPTETLEFRRQFTAEADVAFRIFDMEMKAAFNTKNKEIAELAKFVPINSIMTLKYVQANELLLQKLWFLESFVEALYNGTEPPCSRKSLEIVMQNTTKNYASMKRRLDYNFTTFLNTPHQWQSSARRIALLDFLSNDCADFEKSRLSFIRKLVKSQMEKEGKTPQQIKSKMKLINRRFNKNIERLNKFGDGTPAPPRVRDVAVTAAKAESAYAAALDAAAEAEEKEAEETNDE